VIVISYEMNQMFGSELCVCVCSLFWSPADGLVILLQEKTSVCLQCKSNLTFEHEQSLWNHGRSDWTASEWGGMAKIDGPVS